MCIHSKNDVKVLYLWALINICFAFQKICLILLIRIKCIEQELVPELYTDPAIFVNTQRLSLGSLQCKRNIFEGSFNTGPASIIWEPLGRRSSRTTFGGIILVKESPLKTVIYQKKNNNK